MCSSGEENDDEYFDLKPVPAPVPKPRPLGMESGRSQRPSRTALRIEWADYIAALSKDMTYLLLSGLHGGYSAHVTKSKAALEYSFTDIFF